jgi:hypothetical protein
MPSEKRLVSRKQAAIDIRKAEYYISTKIKDSEI